MDKKTLHDMVKHINYEWIQFNYCCNWLKANKADDTDHPLLKRHYNSMLTAFTVHARNLYWFFYEPPKQDDIGAIHYVPGWSETPSILLTEVKNKVNKYSAHITKTREDSQYAWHWTGIQAETLLVWENFKQAAPGYAWA